MVKAHKSFLGHRASLKRVPRSELPECLGRYDLSPFNQFKMFKRYESEEIISVLLSRLHSRQPKTTAKATAIAIHTYTHPRRRLDPSLTFKVYQISCYLRYRTLRRLAPPHKSQIRGGLKC